MTYFPSVHVGSSREYTNAWPQGYTSPRDRALLNEINGLLGDADYKVCERCRRFISSKGKFDKPISVGAVPNWFCEEWGFCKYDDWDDLEMVRRTDTCDDWEEG